jgi:uncharacterized protein YcnI
MIGVKWNLTSWGESSIPIKMEVNKMKILACVGMVFLFGMLAFMTTASAHVELDPNSAVVGEQIYGINMPNEKDIPTVELRLDVPDNVYVTGILPVSGWSFTTKTAKVPQAKTADGDMLPTDRITEIDWTGSLGAGQYQTFGIATYYGGDPGQLVWKAYQKYSDGTIVAWDDTVDGQPAPKVSIVNKTQIDSLTDAVNNVNMMQSGMSQSSSNSSTILELGIVISILISAASLFISVRRK